MDRQPHDSLPFPQPFRKKPHRHPLVQIPCFLRHNIAPVHMTTIFISHWIVLSKVEKNHNNKLHILSLDSKKTICLQFSFSFFKFLYSFSLFIFKSSFSLHFHFIFYLLSLKVSFSFIQISLVFLRPSIFSHQFVFFFLGFNFQTTFAKN